MPTSHSLAADKLFAGAVAAGLTAGHYLAAHWRRRTLDTETLLRFQEQRAQRMVAYAEAHSPFYRSHWQGCRLDDWRHLPTVDKAVMMAHFDEFNTRGVSKQAALAVALAAEQSRDFAPSVEGLTVGLSSGTSGHRGLFLVSLQEQAAWAGIILARALHDVRRGRTRVAFFLRSHSNLYRQANGALLQLRYFDLMTPFAEAISALNTYQPHILIGPPSLLGFLAGAVADRKLHIRPQRLIAVAEVLEPQDELHLVACFQAPVHQVYQSTEGLLAVSCPHNSLHIQEDIVALQYEPLAPEPLAPEAPAPEAAVRRVTPIVTDLWRRTQPIIRYRLNDVLQVATGQERRACACGSCFRIIERIEGRCDDVCYFFERGCVGQGKQRPFFPDTIRRLVLLAGDGIADYQAVQAQDGQLLVHLALAPGADALQTVAALRSSIVAGVERYGCRRPQLDVDLHLPPLPPGAKRRRVQRLQAGER